MNAPANVASNPSAGEAAEVRVAHYNWKGLAEELSSHGCVVVEKLLSADECRQIAGLYPHEGYFRSHIHMARHGFGKGEYRYFRYPLPDLVGGLRAALYPRLADIANDWNARMRLEQRYPSAHADFLEQCRDRGEIPRQCDAGDRRRAVRDPPLPLSRMRDPGGHRGQSDRSAVREQL